MRHVELNIRLVTLLVRSSLRRWRPAVWRRRRGRLPPVLVSPHPKASYASSFPALPRALA